MGVMRFDVHPQGMLEDWPDAFRAYIGGFDGRIFPTRIEVDKDRLICRRNQPDSGKLHIPWPVEGHGTPFISTAQLREREEPYMLPLELARGKIALVRNQHSSWELAGMRIPDEFVSVNHDAMQLFQRAVVTQRDPEQCAELSSKAIARAFDAADLLTRAYTQQRLAVRRQRSLNLPVSIGCELSDSVPTAEHNERFREAFAAAVVPIQWRNIEPAEGEYNWEINDKQVEWCLERKLMMVGGPLLDLSKNGVPPWLEPWGNDILNLQSFVSDFVETAISRYIGHIRHWEVAARANQGGALSINEENRLALVARMLDVARQVDPEIQLTVRVDQPWGDYQARGMHRLSPLQFVDALVRSSVGLADVNLEFAVGYRENGTTGRDLHEFSRLIDRWSCLGIPLNVTLAFPSAPEDRNGQPVDPTHNAWKRPVSTQAQAEWVDEYLPLLMAKDTVIGVHWSTLADQAEQRFPHAGLFSEDGVEKPALDTIVKYRRAYWQSD